VPTAVDLNKTNLITAKLPNISLKNGRKESLFFITFVNSENWGYGIPFFCLMLIQNIKLCFLLSPYSTLFTIMILQLNQYFSVSFMDFTE